MSRNERLLREFTRAVRGTVRPQRPTSLLDTLSGESIGSVGRVMETGGGVSNAVPKFIAGHPALGRMYPVDQASVWEF